MSKPKKLSPYQAKTFDQVCTLQRDNKDAGDFWICLDGFEITLAAQKHGEACTESVSIPRAQFNRLVSWYMAEQKTRGPLVDEG